MSVGNIVNNQHSCVDNQHMERKMLYTEYQLEILQTINIYVVNLRWVGFNIILCTPGLYVAKPGFSYLSQYLPMRHMLDVMHCEKNLCENIVKTLWGEKDSPAVRKDLQDMNMRPHLWLQELRRAQEEYFIPDAPYILKENEIKEVLKVIQELRTPTNYVGALHTKLSDGKLRGLTSHDYDILMQQILPLCIRNVDVESVRVAIIQMSRVFRRLCAKVVDPRCEQQVKDDVAETLCMMEKEFPPSFFDIITHLVVHLVEELFICGIVHTIRLMYPMERYMKSLKEFVCNATRPEGGMAEGYATEEAVRFCTEYMSKFTAVTRRVWDDKEDPTMVDGILQGKGRPRPMSIEFWEWAHAFVLDNAHMCWSLCEGELYSLHISK